jgi:hypothetical protein
VTKMVCIPMMGDRPTRYERHFRISHHALERLRLRGDHDMRMLDDGPLGDLLDSAVHDASESGLTETVVDQGRLTRVVDISGTLGFDLRALLREDDRRSTFPEIVVTLITGEQASRSRASGYWLKPDEQLNGSILTASPGDYIGGFNTKLGALLKDVDASLLCVGEAAAPIVEKIKMTIPMKTGSDEPAKPKKLETWLVCYDRAGDSSPVTMNIIENGVAAVVERLVDDGVAEEGSIKVYRPVPLKLKTRVVVELGAG